MAALTHLPKNSNSAVPVSALNSRIPGMVQELERLSSIADKLTFSPVEIDCGIAVMLKILDGKCKMPDNEKLTMEAFYRLCLTIPALQLQTYREVIAPFLECDRTTITDDTVMAIYEYRVLAETQISRPVMKKFKARLRNVAVLPPKEA